MHCDDIFILLNSSIKLIGVIIVFFFFFARFSDINILKR
jgi:hypothetical protein